MQIELQKIRDALEFGKAHIPVESPIMNEAVIAIDKLIIEQSDHQPDERTWPICECGKCDPCQVRATLSDQKQESSLKQQIEDWHEMNANLKQLVRRLDVALNGEEGAARQASLCDIVAQVEATKRESGGAAFETLKVLMSAPDYITLGQWKELMRLAATTPEMDWQVEINKLAAEGSAIWLIADLYDVLERNGMLDKIGKNVRRMPTTEIEDEAAHV